MPFFYLFPLFPPFPWDLSVNQRIVRPLRLFIYSYLLSFSSSFAFNVYLYHLLKTPFTSLLRILLFLTLLLLYSPTALLLLLSFCCFPTTLPTYSRLLPKSLLLFLLTFLPFLPPTRAKWIILQLSGPASYRSFLSYRQIFQTTCHVPSLFPYSPPLLPSPWLSFCIIFPKRPVLSLPIPRVSTSAKSLLVEILVLEAWLSLTSCSRFVSLVHLCGTRG